MFRYLKELFLKDANAYMDEINKRLKNIKNVLGCHRIDSSFWEEQITNGKKTGPSYQIAAFFVSQEANVLPHDLLQKTIRENRTISDHDTAEVVREQCRKVASIIALEVLPCLPYSKIEFFSIFLHYNPCLPNHDVTTRIYAVTIYMDKLKKTSVRKLNLETIILFFELENSHIFRLFPRWESRDVQLSPDDEVV